jgi:hypothetical protein
MTQQQVENWQAVFSKGPRDPLSQVDGQSQQTHLHPCAPNNPECAALNLTSVKNCLLKMSDVGVPKSRVPFAQSGPNGIYLKLPGGYHCTPRLSELQATRRGIPSNSKQRRWVRAKRKSPLPLSPHAWGKDIEYSMTPHGREHSL